MAVRVQHTGSMESAGIQDKKKQFEVLCSLMNREDVAYLVNGCDTRQGRLIFRKEFIIWQAVKNQ